MVYDLLFLQDSFSGSQAVNYLIRHGYAEDLGQAVLIGQKMQQHQLIASFGMFKTFNASFKDRFTLLLKDSQAERVRKSVTKNIKSLIICIATRSVSPPSILLVLHAQVCWIRSQPPCKSYFYFTKG